MLWYLAALGSYCLGFLGYLGAFELGIPAAAAKSLGVLLGLSPPALLIRRWWIRRRRERATATAEAPPGPAPAPPRAWSPRLDFADLQQRTVPCRCCNAPMAPVYVTHEIETVQCPYCRRIDEVPREAGQRLAFLRARAAELRGARQELANMDLRVAGVIEDGAWLRGTLLAALGPTALILIFLVLPGLHVGGPQGALIGLAMLSQLGGILLGMALVYRAASRRYLRLVRPRILARAPERPGAPARCRICGGPIEIRGAAFVGCGFCGSTNLVTAELVHECDRFLEAEIAEYRHRAHAAAGAIDAHHQLLGRGLVLGNLLGSMLGAAAFAGLIAVIWHAAS
jgi:hypothetical protein